jgi:hypothetical protein
MSDKSYVLEAPCTQAVPAGTYQVSCTLGNQSRIFRVAADPGYTTCILWDGTSNGFGAVTQVEGLDILLEYKETDNPHDDHTVIVDPEPNPSDLSGGGSDQVSNKPISVVEPNAKGAQGMLQTISALIGVIAALLAGFLLVRKGDDDDD